MKIAYVYDVIYPYVKGGAEKRIWEISKRLARKGHEVHIFGMKFWDGGAVFTKDDVYLHGVCEPKELYVEGRRSIKEAIYYARKLIRPLLKEDNEVIDCQAFPYFPCCSAKLCSTLKRTPLVITWHEVWDDYWYEYLGKKGLFGQVIERMTTRLTGNMIAVSARTAKDLKRVGVKNEISVITNGIDCGTIENLAASEEKTDIIFVGRLIKEKNVDVLIKAVGLVKNEIPEVRCVIIGAGPAQKELELLAADLDLEANIEFTGFLTEYESVISRMKSSKVFVLPSTREGFGIAALEANACGLPVVTVNHEMNAVCDLIKGDNGFRCELSEADIAVKILAGFDKRVAMETSCIESAKGYDWDIIVDAIENYYETVMRS